MWRKNDYRNHFCEGKGLIGVYIANYEIEAYPNHFSRNMPKRKISEEQIRSALAKVYVISDYYKSKIKLDKHVASFKRNAGGNEESVHYRITQHKSTSPYPWYSISENKVSSLKNSGIKTILFPLFSVSSKNRQSIVLIPLFFKLLTLFSLIEYHGYGDVDLC